MPPSIFDKDRYRCSELARLLGRHPNTLRRYQEWGFMSAVPRQANGYRVFSRRHALEGLLAVTALRGNFQEWRGRRLMLELIQAAVAGDYDRARAALARYTSLLLDAQEKLDRAREVLLRWRNGRPGPEREMVGRWRAAQAVDLAPDTLHDWERSGLIRPGRLDNGRRRYTGQDLDRLLVIKVLRDGGYSLMGILSLLNDRSRSLDLGFARDRWHDTLRILLADTDELRDILDALQSRPTDGAVMPP